MEDAFICSGYRHLIHDCTMHHIPTVKIEAATGNPEAVERYENYLVTRRESYHRKKQEAERTA